MRHGLPLIHCVSLDVQAKLLGMIKDIDSLQDCVWSEWLSPEARKGIDWFEGVNTDRFMREKPKSPARVD